VVLVLSCGGIFSVSFGAVVQILDKFVPSLRHLFLYMVIALPSGCRGKAMVEVDICENYYVDIN
jgi:hypothetical protein